MFEVICKKKQYIDCELENSSRAIFWNWVIENKINTQDIAIFVININKLFELTKQDWLEINEKNIVRIFENIEPSTIDSILVQKSSDLESINKYVNRHNLKINIYKGNQGKIKNILNGKEA